MTPDRHGSAVAVEVGGGASALAASVGDLDLTRMSPALRLRHSTEVCVGVSVEVSVGVSVEVSVGVTRCIRTCVHGWKYGRPPVQLYVLHQTASALTVSTPDQPTLNCILAAIGTAAASRQPPDSTDLHPRGPCHCAAQGVGMRVWGAIAG